MAEAFYPFVDNKKIEGDEGEFSPITPQYTTRIAVYDDPLSTPRVVEIAPCDTRTYLEQITETTNRLAHEAGSHIPFMVMREIVENLIHAYFVQPTISILDHGDTITFSDQGPGITDKDLALQYGTTSATKEMRNYIRGVGSGLPYVDAWLSEHDGRLEIQNNISGGTMVTISLISDAEETTNLTPTTSFAESNSQNTGTQNTNYLQPSYQPIQYFVPQTVPIPTYSPYPLIQTNTTMNVDISTQQTQLNSREKIVLDYLKQKELVGPTDLARVYGQSVPTWTRVLKSLEDKGILKKDGQKRSLTDAGKQFIVQ